MASADSPRTPPAGFDELRLGVGAGGAVHLLAGRELRDGAVLEVWFELEDLVDEVRYRWSGAPGDPPWFETAAGVTVPLPPDMLYRWPTHASPRARGADL